MQVIYFESINKILKNKKKLERKLKVKIEIQGKKIIIEGKEEDEYLAYHVLDAINLKFDIDIALLILEEDYVFEKIQIKSHTRRRNLKEVRARIIGKKGKTKQLIEELSECHLSLHKNTLGIIGPAENIRNCIQALKKLIQGSKQSSVYSYLERQRKVFHPPDLGLKE